MSKLILTIKEASCLSGMPQTFIRKQIENGIIPNAYFIQHKYRKTYIIYYKPFVNWLHDVRDNINE